MSHIRLINGQPELYDVALFRRDFPDVLCREPIPVELLAERDIFPLKPTDPPEHPIREAIADTPVLVNGVWEQRWKLADSGDALHRLRLQIALRMFASDFTQCADSGLSGAQTTNWANWRADLRALAQNGTPNAIDWPAPPAGPAAAVVEYGIRLDLLKRLGR